MADKRIMKCDAPKGSCPFRHPSHELGCSYWPQEYAGKYFVARCKKRKRLVRAKNTKESAKPSVNNGLPGSWRIVS